MARYNLKYGTIYKRLAKLGLGKTTRINLDLLTAAPEDRTTVIRAIKSTLQSRRARREIAEEYSIYTVHPSSGKPLPLNTFIVERTR